MLQLPPKTTGKLAVILLQIRVSSPPNAFPDVCSCPVLNICQPCAACPSSLSHFFHFSRYQYFLQLCRSPLRALGLRVSRANFNGLLAPKNKVAVLHGSIACFSRPGLNLLKFEKIAMGIVWAPGLQAFKIMGSRAPSTPLLGPLFKCPVQSIAPFSLLQGVPKNCAPFVLLLWRSCRFSHFSSYTVA